MSAFHGPQAAEPGYARELKIVYDQLQDIRAQILEMLGDDASALLLMVFI